MPPKKQDSKKAAEKAKAKVVEDKTFGLKNKKKSAKVQKYVEEVKKQATSGPTRKTQRAEEGPSKKELEAQKKAELAELFKPVQVQKVPFGTDPKTVLCSFFKLGQCQKGNKCKFSHDMNIERKATKIDMYTDQREIKPQETNEDWDQDKLENVIKSKHGKPQNSTDIICKYFLEAIETSKYGWFWTCPNGGDVCKYRHALPPGYVLKKKEAKNEEDPSANQITLEEFLETERHQLGSNLTPVTYDSFVAWKQRRLDKAAAAEAEQIKAKEAAAKSGRKVGLSGRDLFTYAHEGDDEEDGEDDEFDLSNYMQQNQEADTRSEAQARQQAETAALQSTSNGTTEYFFEPPAKSHHDQVDESIFEGEDLEKLDIEDLESK